MKKYEIMELEGTIVDEEILSKIEQSEEVITVESYGYSEDEDFISYMITLDDGTEIEIYSYF